MKKLKKHITLLFFVCIAFSCSEEKLIDKIYNDTTSGIVVRTLTDPDTISFDIFDTSPTWDMEVEIQDKENGSTLSEVRLYFTFIDNNDEPSDDTSTEALVATYPASHFSTPGEFGLPTGVLSLSYAEALSTAGITVADVLPGDTFFYRVEAELTDGRVFTNDANGTVSGGSFFTSPFQYSESLDDGIEFEVADENRNIVDVTEGATNDDFLFTISIDMSDPAFAEADYLESVTVYRSFSDRNILEGEEDMSEEETVFDEFVLTDFTDTEGVLTMEYGFTQSELYGPDLAFEDLLPNDQFRLRYEIMTTDGRIITTTEADTEYYFTYDVFECIQLNADEPYPGEYTIAFIDDWGDGWNGASIEVIIDGGEPQNYTLENGEEGLANFTVPEGTTTLELFFRGGDYDIECGFTIYDPNDKPAASVAVESAVADTPIELLVCE
ncbi:MAG: hypothetical protein NXH86_15950 [Flavobacteriaceae bacterium]|jgi:hypothetical protein|uniref:hypothetical protein n=1 Tax=Flagellimonas TaxID=444459 RepID=UPI000E2779EF|nr:hypothetical protein [Allomuricauda sp.]MCR9265650.1 hypothetical protein [Flavobacteriaceae bacterium]